MGIPLNYMAEYLCCTKTPCLVSSKHDARSSEVTLTVKFQFANAMLGHAVGQLAKEKVDEMVQAFENRAGKLYGKNKRI